MQSLEKISTNNLLNILKPYGLDLDQHLNGKQVEDLNFEFTFIQPNFGEAQKHLKTWLEAQYHGEMNYLQKHAHVREHPQNLLEDYQAMLMVRVPYIYQEIEQIEKCPQTEAFQNIKDIKDIKKEWLKNAWLELENQPVISWYARGRDYHKVLKQNLKKIADALQKLAKNKGFDLNYRVFTDTMPIMEVEAATQGGLGWRGKHGLLIHPKQGSLFFLGGILFNQKISFFEDLLTNMADFEVKDQPSQHTNHEPKGVLSFAPMKSHCGSCQKCIDICPTKAIIKPYVLDARRCISYLTIEYEGAIDLELRPLIGLHLYGCDECQLICPWNQFATQSQHLDFKARPYPRDLLTFWTWSEDDFLKNTEGSSMRRIDFWQFQRNLAIVSGNFLRQLSEKLNDKDLIMHSEILKNIEALKNRLEEKIKDIKKIQEIQEIQEIKNIQTEILLEHLNWALQ